MSNLCHFLASGSLEREAHRRIDNDWLRQQLTSSPQFIFTWTGSNLFSQTLEKRPLLIEVPEPDKVSDPIFVGIHGERVALFAADLTNSGAEEEALRILGLNAGIARFVPLRKFDGFLSAEERALLFYAKAMTHWQQEQRFCGRCGSRTLPEQAGHVSACTNPECGKKHFPRTDPATIMLVHRGDECLLGRQAAWPKAIYSTLAGFVEAGERVEEAVFREVKEESGIEVKEIRYFDSQPWPFPQSLMLGFYAEAETKTVTVGPELDDVRWFGLPEAREVLGRLAARFPHLDTIARRLIRHWVEETTAGRKV